jgi:hypothetical protein
MDLFRRDSNVPEHRNRANCSDRLSNYVRPGSHWIESIPILRYWPGYLDEARAGHKEELGLFRGQLDKVEQKMATNEAAPCFGTFLIENREGL